MADPMKASRFDLINMHYINYICGRMVHGSYGLNGILQYHLGNGDGTAVLLNLMVHLTKSPIYYGYYTISLMVLCVAVHLCVSVWCKYMIWFVL